MTLFERFEKTYNRLAELRNLYKSACSRPERYKADAEYWQLRGSLLDDGDFATWDLWQAYENSRDYGSACLDLRGFNRIDHIPGLLEAMRQNEVQDFTFFSLRRDCFKVAMAFQDNGCKLESLVNVKLSDDKVGIAFLFKVQ